MRHKKILLFTILLLIPFYSVASERQTLVSGDGGENGGFGGPIFKFTSIEGNTKLLMGGKGAWLMNHQFYFGGSLQGTTSDINDIGDRMMYGGILFGYIGNADKLINYTLELLVGGGEIYNTGLDNDPNTGLPRENLDSSIFVLEPTIMVNMNLTHSSSMNFGISYRYVDNSEHPILTDSKLSGVAVHFGLMFGSF